MGKKMKKNKKGNKMDFERVYGILADARKTKSVVPVKSAVESASVFTGAQYGVCHTGAKLAFTDPSTNQRYYGGGYSRDFDRVEGSILIALDDIVLDTIITGNVPNLPNSEQDTIFIKWDDYTAPRMSKEDWLKMLISLQATGKDISIACMGGHGRTGTALAILGYLSGAIKDKPIEYVRSVYCNQAVESYAQYEYIKRITTVDEMSGAPAARSWNTTTYSPVNTPSVKQENNPKDFINGYNGLDIFQCNSCGAEGFFDEAIYIGNEPYCEYCIQGRAQVDACAACGAMIDPEDDILYVVGGKTYCGVCGEDFAK